MAFIGSDLLNQELKQIVKPFNQNNIANAAYELTLGGEYYLTNSETGRKEYLDNSNSQIVIEPGQFALLITDETVEIPEKYLGFISLKFGQKIKGLVNVSGFHVDPGFSGKIIFSVYNAGAKPIVLDKGSPYFQLWLSDIKDHTNQYNGKHINQDKITASQVEALKGDLASPNELSKRIGDLRTEIDEKLKDNNRIKLRIEWFLLFLITILAGIGVRYYWNNEAEKVGYERGLKEQSVQKEAKNAIDAINLDSLINEKVELQIKENIEVLKSGQSK